MLARERGDLDSAARVFDQASSAAQERGDAALLLGLHWQRALLALMQGDDQALVQHMQAALRAVGGDGYGWSLLWQPQQFAALCQLAIERDVLPRHAEWLLHTALAPWNDAAAAPCVIDVASAPRMLAQADLTPREHEVLHLAAHGLRDREIAAQLCVSTRTVQNHLSNCYSKLGTRCRTEAVQWTLRN